MLGKPDSSSGNCQERKAKKVEKKKLNCSPTVMMKKLKENEDNSKDIDKSRSQDTNPDLGNMYPEEEKVSYREIKL